MGLARTTDDRPRTGIGFLSALICNASLLALALGGALLTIEYCRPNLYSYEISDESLEATRTAIDAAAMALPAEGVDRRTYWGRLVKASVDRSDIDCARGYLLLAPQMLPAEDGQELNRAMSDPSVQTTRARSADARLIQAAVLKLPPDSRAAWTDATAEPDPVDSFISNPLQGLQNLVDMAKDAFKPDLAVAAPPADPFLLEEPDELADTARRIATGQSADMLRFKLTGFAQFVPGTDIVDKGDGSALRNSASVLLGARAQKTLPANLSSVLEQRLDAALPDQKLREALLTAYAAPNAKTDPLALAKAVDIAFEKTADKDRSDDLVEFMKRINAIANSTSEKGAANLLRYAESDTDLSRLQLTAQAGGLRTLALSDRLNKGVLDLAKGKVRARGSLDLAYGLVVASLLALIGAFGFIMFQAISRFVEKRNRESQGQMFDTVLR